MKSITGKLGRYQDDVPALSSLDITDYERIFKVHTASTDGKQFYFYNILDKIEFPENIDSDIFFPKDDSPCLIKLPDSMQQRVDLIAEYVAPDGGMHSEEDSVLNPNNINELEQLLKQQTTAHESEEEEKELFKKFGLK